MDQRIDLPDLGDDDNALLTRLLKAINGKSHFHRTVDAFYDAEKNLRATIGGTIPPQYFNLGLILGWTAKAVDALGRRCHLDRMVWPDGDLGSLGFRELWDDNRLGSEVDQGITSGLIHAVSFAVASRGWPGEPDALIHFYEASDATGDLNPRTRRLENLLVVNEWDGRRALSITAYLRDRTVTGVLDDGRWSSEVSEHQFGVPAAPMAYRPRLKRPFGRSRISRPLRGLQLAATRSLVRLEGHSDVYSYPEFWMLGADPSIFKNEDGSPTDALQVMLGRIKGIPDDQDEPEPSLARADVKKFDATNPTPHLASLNAIAKLFAREANLPDVAVAITDLSNPTSAESYDASQYELIAEAEGAQDEWSPALRHVVQVALAMKNGESGVPDAYRSIDTEWRDARYETRAARADAGLKQLTAAPELQGTEVGYELLGLSDQQIKRVQSDVRRRESRRALDALAAAVPSPGDRMPAGSSAGSPGAE